MAQPHITTPRHGELAWAQNRKAVGANAGNAEGGPKRLQVEITWSVLGPWSASSTYIGYRKQFEGLIGMYRSFTWINSSISGGTSKRKTRVKNICRRYPVMLDPRCFCDLGLPTKDSEGQVEKVAVAAGIRGHRLTWPGSAACVLTNDKAKKVSFLHMH
jgi:hypothetical protein